ncbi:hypothetical protein PHYBOEH_011385 [Phytophthora boehmeriae]|uniref:Uncharacterized protein n=1 Tax=Phytophthora boehmeriae TaxID=109152 RepID=A0A8T1VHN0_9STRA|nr:hypothetical protein PHYBOEH_011385 [Phytophthora boehmeriae]
MTSFAPDTAAIQSRSPGSCGSSTSDLEEIEHLSVADTILADDNWIWLRNLLDPVSDETVRQQSKVYFARLHKTQNAAGIETTLAEMETWRSQLGDERTQVQEHELARALFLLGFDKSMSLSR